MTIYRKNIISQGGIHKKKKKKNGTEIMEMKRKEPR
jgi:hypothetical protein